MRCPLCSTFCSTCGESSKRRISAALSAAWLLLCLAMVRFACRMAGTSLTPSPTTATDCPPSRSISTTCAPCSGVRWPKMVFSWAARVRSSGLMPANSKPDIVCSNVSSLIPACLRRVTVRSGALEVRILMSTPVAAKASIVSTVSGRTRSV